MHSLNRVEAKEVEVIEIPAVELKSHEQVEEPTTRLLLAPKQELLGSRDVVYSECLQRILRGNGPPPVFACFCTKPRTLGLSFLTWFARSVCKIMFEGGVERWNPSLDLATYRLRRRVMSHILLLDSLSLSLTDSPANWP